MAKSKGVYEKEPGSGVWWIRYADIGGHIRREKAGNRGAAIKLYAKRKTEVLQGKKLPETLKKRAVSFSDLVQDALVYSKTHKLSYRDDVYRMKRLKGWFGERPADIVTPQEIERNLADAEDEEELAPATLNRYKALLSLVYRLGIENGKVSMNPARLVKHRRENNARIRFLDHEEEGRLRKVIAAESPEHMPEFDFALNTGLRRGEMYNLTWEYVNLTSRIVTVRRSKHGETRHVPLNRRALAVLVTIRALGKATGPVFLNSLGERLTSPRYWFEPAVEKAKVIDFTWHCLRHTFASRLAMSGVSLREVQELMGHKTIQMTCRYAHLAPSHQLAAVEKLVTFSAQIEAEIPTDPKTGTSTTETNKAELACAI